ncbi:MAG TPA: S9 family peptidase [Sphingobacteriaceae bacterium]|nr:S9 family peptidase [Sphingobacteriaceae bacterium]
MNKLLLVFLLLGSTVMGQTSKEITLEDIYQKGTFSTKSVYGLRSMNDGKTYVSIEYDSITKERFVAKNNYSDGKLAEKLFSEKELMYNDIQLEVGTNFSDNESKVLIAYQSEPIYRRSSKAYYYVFDLDKREVKPISTKEGKQQYANFSPDATKVAFMRDNDLYVTDLRTGNETRITHDGKYNEIINGGADWVYEEEFSFAKAFFWSPDSRKIAFYKFDESKVKEFSMMLYDSLYPTVYKFKYPKAGEKNSIVSIHIHDLSDTSTKTVDIGTEKDQYIPRIKWTQDPNTLLVLRMNRHQNQLEYLFANANTGDTKLILEEKDKYYIDINDDLTFLKDGKHFVLTSERNGYNHVYLYDTSGKLIRSITKGDWEVTSLYGIDEKSGTLYYQSTEGSPLERDIYAINISGNKKRKISTKSGTNSATFSADFSYYILNHSNVDTPPYITLNNTKNGKVERILEDNSLAKQTAISYGIQPREFFQFTTSENVDLNGYMIKPKNFDENVEYPVLMYVYGGPGSQEVANRWARNVWFDYLAQEGYLIVCVDNRGTGFRGSEFKKMTYLQLGKYETIDQIEAAKWLGQQSYVDKDRIGLWGWSYGGYLASLAITKGADIFKSTIAVAPVTSWRYYDTIYTERYLRTPQENPEGYDDNSPINFVDQLEGNFLLVHGTSDDNVHFQNSVLFSEALIEAGKTFDQAYYPNKNHGISGKNTSIQLFTKLTNFILNNL